MTDSQSTPEEQPVKFRPPPANSGKMITTLSLVAMISGFLVVLVYQYTQPLIAENQRIAVEKAIYQVLPGAVSWKSYVINGDQLLPAQSDGTTIYAGFNDKGDLTGIASEAAAQGYADVIKLLYGYNPACECITGIKVLKSAETPGLGDKIYKDKAFVKNFDALAAQLNADKSALEHDIVTVKHGTKTQPWQIDSISGATVSSKAVGKALNGSAQFLLPRLIKQLQNIIGSNKS